ncbi:MAG: hypothetical protein SFU86_02735, partial [Pirellulaceae bacterium]|nr:hypothetical protein [Pirellulaceae bacterium]
MDQPHVLKPTIALHAISLAVLFGSLVFISGSIASLFVLWDPCAVLGGVVFLPISLAFGVNQYRGTYHRNRAAANLTAILLFGSGGTIAFGFGILLGQVLLRGGDIQGTPFLLSFAFSAFCLIAGWMNLQWSRRLVQAGVSAQNMDLRGQFTLREMLFAVLALSVVTILVAGAVRSTPRQFAEHVARDEAPLDLPTSARDVCFCQGSRGTIACEF